MIFFMQYNSLISISDINMCTHLMDSRQTYGNDMRTPRCTTSASTSTRGNTTTIKRHSDVARAFCN